MSSKRWLHLFLLITLIPVGFTMLVNYVVDPLFYFSHENVFNSHQKGFNERQQKTIFLKHHHSYNAIIIGSSRVTYLNPKSFTFCKPFNFAVSAMRTYEYLPFALYFKQHAAACNYIIIGFDFYPSLMGKSSCTDSPDHVLDDSGFSFANLTSYDLLKKSFDSLCLAFDDQFDYTNSYYDREMIKHMYRTSDLESRNHQYYKNLELYKSTVYKKENRTYDISKDIHALKAAFPKAKFIVFTTPVAASLFEIIKTNGVYKQYEDWLTVLVENFGSLYHFMYINEFTKNRDINFADGHHLYPASGELIIDFMNKNGLPVNENIGMKIDKNNLSEKLKILRKYNGVAP